MAKGEIASFSPRGWHWDAGQSEPRPQARSRDLVAGGRRQCGRLARAAPPLLSSRGRLCVLGRSELRGEFRKELIGELLGRAVDQALAQLRQLAADLGLDVVGQQSAAVLVGA